MKIHVINPRHYVSRRRFQQQQAERLGLHMEFVDAVSLADMTEDQFQAAANEWTRPITAKDVACTLSHKKAWQAAAAANGPVCICEDDVVFDQHVTVALEQIACRNDPWNRIYDLEYVPRSHDMARTPLWHGGNPEFSATRVLKNKYGAGGYVITPRAAQRLLDETPGYVMLDAWLWTRPWLETCQIEPCPLTQTHNLASAPATENARPDRFYRNTSWISAKRKRLQLSLDEAWPSLKARVAGIKRPLAIALDRFSAPDPDI